MITHEHLDHAAFTAQYLLNGLDCYMTAGTKNAIDIEHHRINEISMKQVFNIGTWKILPFDVEHDAAEPCGFLLQSELGYKLLFVTDTYFVRYKFKGITHMMLEVNYIYDVLQENIDKGLIHRGLGRRIMKSHFSLEHALNFLEASDTSKLSEIHLIHLSSNNSNAHMIKQAIQIKTGKPVYIAGGKT